VRAGRYLAEWPSRAACAVVMAASLWGCQLPTPQTTVAAAYDFGPEREKREARDLIKGVVLIPAVNAPTWLESTGIVYRLLYEDGARPRVYSLSRWIAPPAEMLTDRVRDRFADVARAVVTSGYGAREDYVLRVELDNFSQQFDAPDKSRIVLRARATLVSGTQRNLIAQHEFAIEGAAEPNATGAVKALSEASSAFIDDLVKWVAESVAKTSAVKS
jgi:cholesterol transport system auxiliary component